MRFPASLLIVCVLLIAMAVPRGPSLARERDLIHKMPPISAQRTGDIIVQMPPLRPAAEPEALAATPQARKAWSAPTLEEAPRRAYDAPSLAEIDPPAPDAALRLSDTVATVARPNAPAVELQLPGPASSTLVEWLRRREVARPSACGVTDFAVLSAIATDRAGPTVLVDFLPCEVGQAAHLDVATGGGAATPAAPDAQTGPADYMKYLAGVGVALGVFALFAHVGRRRLRARAAARLAAMSSASSTAELRVVAQMPTLKSPLIRVRDFFNWLLMSVGGLRRGTGVPAPAQAAPSTAPASMLGKVAALMRSSEREEAPAPPVDLSRIVRTVRAPTLTATALAEAMLEPLRESVETLPRTMQLGEQAEAVLAPPPVTATVRAKNQPASATDDLVLVEPGDAVAASAAINAARMRLEGQR